jgi:Holliday junction resolvasome RuvABC endonuclease subunit
MTKKMKEFKHKYVSYVPYDKIDAKDYSYSVKENKKFSNIASICNNIATILEPFKDEDVEVYMEGVSYGSVGSAALVDLSFLNAAIRMTLHYNNIPFTIVSPTSLKKFACANGQADKNLMIDAWKRMDKNIADIKDLKIDDLADSYFLSLYKDEN